MISFVVYENQNIHIAYIFKETNNHFFFNIDDKTYSINKNRLQPLEYSFFYNYMYGNLNDCRRIITI
jgi:hypothetical protein